MHPSIEPGERVYIVAYGRVRGYAPLVRIEYKKNWGSTPPVWWWPYAKWALVRSGGAVACTIPMPVRGIPGWRYRFWQREDEQLFQDWQTVGVVNSPIKSATPPLHQRLAW